MSEKQPAALKKDKELYDKWSDLRSILDTKTEEALERIVKAEANEDLSRSTVISINNLTFELITYFCEFQYHTNKIRINSLAEWLPQFSEGKANGAIKKHFELMFYLMDPVAKFIVSFEALDKNLSELAENFEKDTMLYKFSDQYYWATGNKKFAARAADLRKYVDEFGKVTHHLHLIKDDSEE